MRGRAVRTTSGVAFVVALLVIVAMAALGVADRSPPAVPVPPQAPTVEPVIGDIVVANEGIEVHVSNDDDSVGALAIVDRSTGEVVASGLGRSIEMPDGLVYRIPGDVVLRGEPTLARGVSTPLGPAAELRVPFASVDGAFEMDLYVSVPAQAPSFFLQMSVRGAPGAGTSEVVYFRPLDAELGRFGLAEDPLFLSDATTILQSDLVGGEPVEELIGVGSPVYLAGTQPGKAAVFAVLEESTAWPKVTVWRDGETMGVGLEVGPIGRLADGAPYVDDGGGRWSPSLFFDLAPSDTRLAFVRFKRVVDVLYPPPPLPSWFGPQWDSYWAYDLDITEDNVLANATAIDQSFRDLGPWGIIFDAGWYVDGGAPDAAPDVIDAEKFPSGLAPVTAALRRMGMRSILYFSAPYLDTRPSIEGDLAIEGPPEWMSLPGFIARHPEMVRSLSDDPSGPSFMYDFLNPTLVSYIEQLMRLYLRDWGGDGILLDLVGEAGPAVADWERGERAPGGRLPLVAAQSMEVYRVVWEAARAARPDALVEGSWIDPIVSRPYSHSWRYGDELPLFSFVYPFNGLVEKVDYAVTQHEMLGMRPHIGYLRGPAYADEIQRWWMGASLALGAQVGISVDFTDMTSQAAEVYREYLAAYAPFQGTTVFGPGGLKPDWFATSRDGVTYLGIINRGYEPTTVDVQLSDLGLAGALAAAFEPETDQSFLIDGGFSIEMPEQSFRLIVLRDSPGVLWGSRKVSVDARGQARTVDVAPSPLSTGGRLVLWAGDQEVRVDTAGGFFAPLDPVHVVRLSLDDPGAARVTFAPPTR